MRGSSKKHATKKLRDKVRRAEKPLIYVITKCDLVDKSVVEKAKKQFTPCVFVSAKEFHGTTLLRERILIEAKRKYADAFSSYRVGVLGLP